MHRPGIQRRRLVSTMMIMMSWRLYLFFTKCPIFTVCNGKVIFSQASVSHSVHRGMVSASMHAGIHPPKVTPPTPPSTYPLGRYPPGRYTPPPPAGTPLGRYTQPGMYTPGQVHPLDRYTPHDSHCIGRYASYWNAFLLH